MLPEEQFYCLACAESMTLLANFSAVTSHFLSAHGVSFLLEGPGTRAVLLPRTLTVHNCLLCGQKLVGREYMEEHMGEKHGEFFQEIWQHFSATHYRYVLDVLVYFLGLCRVCEDNVADADLEEHIASSHPRSNFATQSKKKIGAPETLLTKKKEVSAEVNDEVVELLEKLNLTDGSSCTKKIINVHSASPSRSSSPARQVSPWLPGVEDYGEQDWCPLAPTFGRELLPDPLPVVMALSLETETQTKMTNSPVVNTKPVLGEEELLSSRELKMSENDDNVVTVRVRKVKKCNIEVLDDVGYSNDVEVIKRDKPFFKKQSAAANGFSIGNEPMKSPILSKPVKHEPCEESVEAYAACKIVKPVKKPGLGGRYKFDPSCPVPDPRWPSDQQVMLGPISEKLTMLHSYSEFRKTLRGRLEDFGKVCHLFLQKSGTGTVSKYGYLVFTDQTSTKLLLRSKSVSLARYQVQVNRMHKTVLPTQGGEGAIVRKQLREVTRHNIAPQGQAEEEGSAQKPVCEAISGLGMKIVSGRASLMMKVTDQQAKIVVGIGGKRIMPLEKKLGVKIDIPRDKSKGTKNVIISGPLEAVEIARVEVNKIFKSA